MVVMVLPTLIIKSIALANLVDIHTANANNNGTSDNDLQLYSI